MEARKLQSGHRCSQRYSLLTASLVATVGVVEGGRGVYSRSLRHRLMMRITAEEGIAGVLIVMYFGKR